MRSLIVAVSENGVIGNENRIPWIIPEDLKYFRSVTAFSSIIMGNNTFKSIGKPLVNRQNIVITSNKKSIDNHNIFYVNSIQEALNTIMCDTSFIIGGKSVYEQFLSLNLIDKIYYTKIFGNFDGDTYFPEINWNEWELIQSTEFSNRENQVYIRK